MDLGFLKNTRLQLGTLPPKLNFKIGEVSCFLGVKPHTLRYWEEEFSLLSPKKFHNGQRIYFRKDMEILLLIKHLLYSQKYSIKGVKKNLSYYYRELKKTHDFEGRNKGEKSTTTEKLKRILERISETRELVERNNFS